jgi:predicted choloylglycine hydrolase
MGLLMGQKFAKEASDAIALAKSDNWEGKSNVGEKTLDITQKYFPHFIEELKGYAKGAGVDFLDLWTVSIEGDAEVNEKAKCTNIITNQGRLIGHNEDAEVSGQENMFCLVKKTIKDLTTFEIYSFNSLGGNTIGINSHGYAQTINTLLFTPTRLGIPKNVIGRYLLETQNPDKDIEMVLSLPRSSGYNHNIVSKNGEIWNLELTADTGIVTKPKLPFAHSNHCLNVKSDFQDDYGTVSRLKFASDNAKDEMTIEEVIKLQSDTSAGPKKSIFNDSTVGKVIIDFDNMIAKIWLLREKELGWVDYPLDFIV